MSRLTHTATTLVAASPQAVWKALTDPGLIARWQLGAAFDTDWRTGSPLVMTATIGAKTYRDRGHVRLADPPRVLEYDILPRITALPDEPQNYSIIRFDLTPAPGDLTELTVTHSVPPSPIRRGKNFEIGPESGIRHVEFWWRSTLPILKAVAEGKRVPPIVGSLQ